jgi:hypothetical protein
MRVRTALAAAAVVALAAAVAEPSTQWAAVIVLIDVTGEEVPQ